MAVKYTTVARIYQSDPAIASVSDVTSQVIADVFIADAEAIVDSYLSKSYTLPLSGSIPSSGVFGYPALTAIATDITIYRILSHRMLTQERLKNSTWPDRFKESMGILEGIAEGSVLIVSNSGSVVTDATNLTEVWSNTSGYTPTMSELDPESSQVDPDKVTDLARDRDLGLDIVV